MEYTIEVGSPEQRRLIREDISLIDDVCAGLSYPSDVEHVIVPADFDATVNRLEGTTGFRSLRGFFTCGKAVHTGDSTTILLSPVLFTEKWDDQMRLFVYVHEVLHSATSLMFPQPLPGAHTPRTLALTQSMYALYDEYWITRKTLKALNAFLKEKSEGYLGYVASSFDSYADPLLDDWRYYWPLTWQIAAFRIHGDINHFLEVTRDMFDEVSKCLVYVFAYMDYGDQFTGRRSDVLKSPFAREGTLALVDYFRGVYDEGSVDVSDGVDLMDGFTACLGVRWEDTADGKLYCRVLSI